METNLTLFVLGALFAIGGADLSAQNVNEMGIAAGDLFKEIRDLKKEVEAGNVTAEVLVNDPYHDANLFLKKISDPAARSQLIKKTCFNEKDAAIITKELDALIPFLNGRGIKYEPPVNPALKFVLDEIVETTNTVNEFDPKTKIWTASYEWIWRAVSKGKPDSDREKWAVDFFRGNEGQKTRFYTELDKLAAAYAKKVSLLSPKDDLFTVHSAPDEALMKKEISSGTKIHKIGIQYKDWETEWDENAVIKTPAKRFKRAFIYGDPNDGTGYCRVYQINLIQNYQGNGSYASTYAKYLNSWPRLCPGK